MAVTLSTRLTRGLVRKAVERTALDLGFEGIAFPSEDMLDYAERLGVGFEVHHGCCAAIAFHVRG